MQKALPSPIVTTNRGSSSSQPQLEPKLRKGKGITELHQAVISADYDQLTELLQQRPSKLISILAISRRDRSLDVNDQDALGWTTLHWAVRQEDDKSVEVLLGDPQTKYYLKDEGGRTPLHEAAIHGWDKGIEMLLQKDKVGDPEHKGINIQDSRGRTALHWSAERGHCNVIEVLAKTANCEAIDIDGNTALHMAAQRGHEKAVKILTENNANLKPENQDGKTPFMVALKNGYEEISWLFLQNRKLQNQHTSMALDWIEKYPVLQKKLLFWAAKGGYADAVQGLLDRRTLLWRPENLTTRHRYRMRLRTGTRLLYEYFLKIMLLSRSVMITVERRYCMRLCTSTRLLYN